MKILRSLSRREREMMDIVFAAGRVTAGEVRERMAAPPSYSAVRATLSILERKGILTHDHEGKRYVYRATVGREQARRRALDHLLATFFDGSAAGAVVTLLERRGASLSDEDLDRMERMIARARREGR